MMSDTNTQDPQTTPEDSTTQQPDTAQGQHSGNGTQDSEPTFTQTDIDRIVSERLKRDRETQREKLLAELGVDDTKRAKELLEAAKEREEAELTAAQKLEKQLLKEQEEKQSLQAEIERMKAQRIADERETVFKDAMRKAGGQDVNRLFILVNAEKGEDFAALFDDESNAVKDTQLEKFIKQVQADYSNYFATAGAGSPSNAGGTPPSPFTSKEEARKEVQRKHGKL